MNQKYTSLAVAALLVTGLFAATAMAATSVTTSDTQGWSTSDTRPGGAVTIVSDPTSPYPDGTLQLTTDDSTTAKAQYMHSATTSLSSISELSYYTKQVAGPVYADPSYQLMVDLNGAADGGFTTLVYEPYQQTTAIVPGTWQQWDVSAGQLWSSRSFSDGSCVVVAGAGGAPFYTLNGLQTSCPDAVVLGYGVNVGSNNPGYDVYTDGLNFNGTVYDFQMGDTTAPAAPTPLYPANGAVTTTATQDRVDWTDVSDASSPVTYVYQASYSSATNPDGSFVSPVYTSGPLASSEIATPNTPEGTYYWHVQATDGAGNLSSWSTTWSFTVDNSEPVTTQPTDMNQCKKGGWATFTNPSYKNQGQCVSAVAKNK